MDADDFRDYMLSFLFLRYLSDNYETTANKELGADYPAQIDSSVSTSAAAAEWHHETDYRLQTANKKSGRAFTLPDSYMWSRRQESNLDLSLRRAEFYPLKYSEEWGSGADRSR